MVQGDEGDAIYFLESGGAVAIKDSKEGAASHGTVCTDANCGRARGMRFSCLRG